MYSHEMWRDSTGNWDCLGKFRIRVHSHRPLTIALSSNKQPDFPKKSDITPQKDWKRLPAIRIRRQWQQLWVEGQKAGISKLFQHCMELGGPPYKITSLGHQTDLHPLWSAPPMWSSSGISTTTSRLEMQLSWAPKWASILPGGASTLNWAVHIHSCLPSSKRPSALPWPGKDLFHFPIKNKKVLQAC